MDTLESFYTYDELLVEPLVERGWSVEFISWRNRDIDWNRFDVVVIRSPWDYQEDPGLFLDVLEEIDSSDAHLENSLELVKWNLSKIYLRDLQNKGVQIVPSLWFDGWNDANKISVVFNHLDTDEVVIKPLISANADHTYRLKKSTLSEQRSDLQKIFIHRPFMIQPFIKSIVTEGEYSLFYFGNEYSHAIVKKPAKGDFRVQEEHGGSFHPIKPEPELSTIGRETVQNITPLPLYSRMDLTALEDGTYALMELELIEPSLYFNMDPESPERFARIFQRRMATKT